MRAARAVAVTVLALVLVGGCRQDDGETINPRSDGPVAGTDLPASGGDEVNP